MKKLFLAFSFVSMILLVACDSGSETNSMSQEGKKSSDGSNDSDGKSNDSESVSSDSERGESSGNAEGFSASILGDSNDTGTYDMVTGTLTDSRDGQTYRTVKIGDQVWMAENLNYEIGNSYCYGNDLANCAKYGRLYTWAAAMDSVGEWSTNGRGCGNGVTCSAASVGSATMVRGICPKDWHLPGIGELFDELITTAGGSSIAGTKLKSIEGWKGSGNGSDTYSFSALPAGIRYSDGTFSDEGDKAFFWSSTEDGSDNVYSVNLSNNNEGAGLGNGRKNSGFSVRCLKD
jgi:uncharacterized protein (TIGR02145 family)